MRALNIRIPAADTHTHDLYSDEDEMYIVVGHSAALLSAMNEAL